jgi:pSer/pThr/pTyr-binding forkhead associated (FHA) protein
MYKLVICDDEGKTTIVPLIRDEIAIGRKEGNTIRLTDRNVSRGHARLIRKGDKFLIEDIGSLVGTKVNGSLLRASSLEVSPNDHITIGDYSISIRTDVSADVPLGRQLELTEEAGIGKVTPFARLVMIKGPTLGREVELTAELYVIGRSEEANCRIEDPSISRAHARIDLEGNDWTISDLDSVNGILVNGFHKDDYVLKTGDVIEMGGVQLRFVAPGEPYEYLSPNRTETTAPVVEAPSRTPLLLYILGGIGLAAVIAITVVLNTLPSQTAEAKDGRATDDTSLDTSEQRSPVELVQLGKDKMQSQEWTEAARLFALALQQQPGSTVAAELKKTSIAESDALAALNESGAFVENKDLRKALSALERIPRSSRYFDDARIRELSEKLCLELQTKARNSIAQRAFGAAELTLSSIDDLAQVSESCALARKSLLEELYRARVAAPDEGRGSPPPSNKHTQHSTKSTQSEEAERPPVGFAGSDNPYRQVGGSGKSGQDTQSDPVGEARAAMQRGDTKGAIRILERGGNSRSVLALLASLYRQTGNKSGYETVARKFLKLYPGDPKAAQFRRDLGK